LNGLIWRKFSIDERMFCSDARQRPVSVIAGRARFRNHNAAAWKRYVHHSL
jgi:hypothetical protein